MVAREDVKDEVVAAIPAHAGQQRPASRVRVVGCVIALRRDDDKIMVRACVGAGRENAQRGALGRWPILRILRYKMPSKPVLNEPRG